MRTLHDLYSSFHAAGRTGDSANRRQQREWSLIGSMPAAHRPRALALIGDIYHGPVLMRDGLITALVRENIPSPSSRIPRN